MTVKAVQVGDVVNVTAPTGGYTSGQLIEFTDIVGLCHDAYAAGDLAAIHLTGVFDITKTAHAAGGFTFGDTVYVSSTGLITNVSTSNQKVGIAMAASATSETSVPVHLNFA